MQLQAFLGVRGTVLNEPHSPYILDPRLIKIPT